MLGMYSNLYNSVVPNMTEDIGNLFSKEFSGKSAKRVVGVLTQFHRGRVSPGIDQAIEFVQKEAEKACLQNLVVEKFHCDGKKKWWTWKTPHLWYPRDFELKVVKPREVPLARMDNVICALGGGSCSTPPEGVTAEVVDVGKGMREEDYVGKDVSGKFVLISGVGWGAAHAGRIAKHKGAIGYITDSIIEAPPVRTRVDVPDLIGYVGAAIEDDGTSILAFGIDHKQMWTIKGLLEEGPVEVYAKSDTVIGEGYLKVLTGVIEGTTRKEEEVLIISHICHPAPGANDNASGSAMILELARTLCSLIKAEKISRPKRTLRFMWTPEWSGIIAYAHSHPNWPKNVLAVLCCDMVGENQQICGGPFVVEKTPDTIPSYLNDLIERYLELIVKGGKMYYRVGDVGLWKYQMVPFGGGSDHTPLADPSFKVPGVNFGHWPDRFYHSSGDTVDKVDPEELEKVAWVVAMTALEIANARLLEAELLASETTDQGLRRLGKCAHDGLQKLRRIGAGKDNAMELAKCLRKSIEVLDYRLHIELEAVASVSRFVKNIEEAILRSKIDNFQEVLQNRKSQLGNQLKETAISLGGNQVMNLAEKPELLTEIEKKAQMMIPIRKWMGPLNITATEDILGWEKTKWLRELMVGNLRVIMALMIVAMLVDGKRSVLDIARFLKLRGIPMDDEAIEALIHYFHNLEEANLVEFRD